MQPLTEPTAELSVDIAAPADQVWAVVADPTRTPEWSPVCHRCEWIGEARHAAVGARFRGHNRLNGARWSRECVVTEADEPRVFAFSTVFKAAESTRWRYRLTGSESGTMVTEAYQVVTYPLWIRLVRSLPGMKAKNARDTEWNIRTSLERLKALVEGGAAPRE